MHRTISLAVAVSAALLSCTGAMAMGFTRTVTQSTLGQPLNFVATIALEQDENLSRECLSAQVIAGDARVPPPNVHVSVGPVRDAGLRDVRISTTAPIDEPVVSVELSIGCTSTMTRRFVVFIDPPSLQLAQVPSAADGADIDGPRVATQTAALADLARRSDASRRANGGEPGSDAPRNRHAATRTAHAQRLADAAAPAPPAPPASHSHVASSKRRGSLLAAAPNRAGSRLQLDAPRLLAAGPPAAAAGPVASTQTSPASAAVATASTVLPPIERAPALPAPASDAASAIAAEHERMAMLEAGLASLRADSIATKKTVGVLQAKLRDAEDARYSNGLIYALAAVSLLLGLLVAALLYIRPRQRRRARWFDAAAQRHARTTQSAEREEAAGPMPTIRTTSMPSPAPGPTSDRIDLIADFAPSTTAFSPPTQPAGIGGLEVTTVLGPQFARAMLPPSPNAGADELAKRNGDLSMEELIDLEQQAEFFVVLGQDEAAMSLLDNYMRSDGGKSPLPYLQLLEIHQRRADQSAYESVRRAFNVRFKANAPEWSTDLHFGRALVDYPQTIARLQSLWATPLSAMQALDALLFRRHAVDDTFDFPAYRELLFLYSIARELSGQVETDFGSIDLFLPLEDAAFSVPAPAPAAYTMSGGLELAVDLDVTS